MITFAESEAEEVEFVLRDDADVDAVHERLAWARPEQDLNVVTSGGKLFVSSQEAHTAGDIRAFVHQTIKDLIVV